MSLTSPLLPAGVACRLVLAAVLFPSVALSESPAADQIWLEPSAVASATDSAGSQAWYAPSIDRVIGQVKKFDGSVVSYVPSGATESATHTASRVIWIQRGDVPAAEHSALTLFRDQKYAEALRPLLDSLQARPPVWRQQFLSMAAAQAAWRSGRGKIALELVSQLDRRPLPPMVIGWLPIQWHRAATGAADDTAAIERLSDPSAAVRLVAASWLIASDKRTEAIRTLRQLSAQSATANDQAGNDQAGNDHFVRPLAAALLWRVATPVQAKASSQQWLAQIESMPMCMQTGPTIALAEKLDSAGMESESKRLKLSLAETPIAPHPDVPR